MYCPTAIHQLTELSDKRIADQPEDRGNCETRSSFDAPRTGGSWSLFAGDQDGWAGVCFGTAWAWIRRAAQLVDGIEAQTRQAVANLTAVLQAAGTGMEHVVKTTIFVTDMANFATVNGVYGAAFDGAPPARSTVEVSALPLGGLVEIEAIALVP